MTGVLGTPAGWYADPLGRFEYRYWDGAGWTEHVTSGGSPAVDPLQPAATENPTPEVAVESSSGQEPQQPKGWLGRTRAGRQEKRQGRSAFDDLINRAANADPDAMRELPAAFEQARQLWRPGQLDSKSWEAMTVAVREVIADDVVTVDEERHITELGRILGTPVEQMREKNFQLFEEYVVAAINDGRLPTLPNPPIMLKSGESALASFGASLMKEVQIREFRGGSSGVSIPLGGGVRYRTSSVRGRSVVVGTQQVADDQGTLTMTTQRCVFVGNKKTLEFRFDKLVGLEQFKDGLRMNVSNRQTASLFTMQAGQSPAIAAALIVAAQRTPG